MPLLADRLLSTAVSFYSHNSAIIYYALGMGVAMLRLLWRPSRLYFLVFLGFLMLIFAFEYRKHFIPHTQSHIVAQLANPEENPEEFAAGTSVVTHVIPFLLEVGGWGLVLGGLFFVGTKDPLS